MINYELAGDNLSIAYRLIPFFLLTEYIPTAVFALQINAYSKAFVRLDDLAFDQA